LRSLHRDRLEERVAEHSLLLRSPPQPFDPSPPRLCSDEPRGERWAWRISIANALTVIALPCLLVYSMGLGYFASAPLLIAGAVSITAAGLLMLLPLVWARRDILPPA
jgi:hypothetical protein